MSDPLPPAAETAESQRAAATRRAARRQWIRSALGAVPTVLTVTAGKALAQGSQGSPTSDEGQGGGFQAPFMEMQGDDWGDAGAPADPLFDS